LADAGSFQVEDLMMRAAHRFAAQTSLTRVFIFLSLAALTVVRRRRRRNFRDA